MIDLAKISPQKAYSVLETADLIGIHPNSLRRKIQKGSNDPFIDRAKPVDIGSGWVFNGANLLDALGTPAITNSNENTQVINSGGVAPLK